MPYTFHLSRLIPRFAGMAATVVACSSASESDGCNVSLLTAPAACQTLPVEITGGSVVDADGVCPTSGGATAGPDDMHCDEADGGEVRQQTNQQACCDSADAWSRPDGGEVCLNTGALPRSVYPDDGTCCNAVYGPSMYGQQGSDDGCKYDVSWTSTPVCVGTPVYFTVHATLRVNATSFGSGKPLTGAGPFAEVVLDCTYRVPNSDPPVEFAPGWYQVGPIVFTEPGKWDVRFHFNENCLDELPDSPNGHAAFWVTVPAPGTASGDGAGDPDQTLDTGVTMDGHATVVVDSGLPL